MDITGEWTEEFWEYDFDMAGTYIKTHTEDLTEITTGEWSFDAVDTYTLTVDGFDDIETILLENGTDLNSSGHYLESVII